MAARRIDTAILDEILARVSRGEHLKHICREPGMPRQEAVYAWGRADAAFDARRRAALQRGRDWRITGFDPAMAAEILSRMAEGERLHRILAREGRPSRRTFRIWLANHAEFAEAVFHLRGERMAVRVLKHRRARRCEFDPALADRIVARCYDGVELRHLRQALPGAPAKRVLARWRREQPGFDRNLRFALQVANLRRQRFRRCNAAMIEAVTDRVAAGESLSAIARDPAMPCRESLYNWTRRRSDFREALQAARAARAQMLADEALALAEARRPGNAAAFHRLKRKVEQLDAKVMAERPAAR